MEIEEHAPIVSDTTEEPNTSRVINLTYKRQSNSYQSNNQSKSNQSNTNRSGTSSNRSDSSKISSGNNGNTVKKQEVETQKESVQTVESIPSKTEEKVDVISDSESTNSANSEEKSSIVTDTHYQLDLFPMNNLNNTPGLSTEQMTSTEDESGDKTLLVVIVILSIIVVLLYAVVFISSRQNTVKPITVNLTVFDDPFIINLLSQEDSSSEGSLETNHFGNDDLDKTTPSGSKEEIE